MVARSKTVADLKAQFPALQENIKTVITAEMQRAIRDEKWGIMGHQGREVRHNGPSGTRSEA